MMCECIPFLIMVNDTFIPQAGVGARKLRVELADEYQACHYELAEGMNVITSV